MTDVTSQLAMPGDPDLDADIDGLVITSVVAFDDTRRILIHGGDAHGRFVDTTGQVADHPPGHPTARITAVELSCRMPDMPDHLWADYVSTLCRWRDEAVPLRMTSAAGRVTMLIEDRDRFLPFPRRSETASETAL